MGESQRPGDRIEVESLRYEPNPKHKPIPAPGRHGSICPRGVDGPLLLAGSSLFGSKRFATDGQDAYCAQQHTQGGWHGYPVDWEEVPPRLVSQWVAAEKVSRKSIRQARRRGGR